MKTIDKGTINLAKILWDYHLLHHKLQPSDCIMALGSHDLRVADRAAEIYLEGWAPLLLVSGGLGNLTKEVWTVAEADQFAEIAIKKGVPLNSILVENRSTNTGENIDFSKQLLAGKNLDPQKIILVQKPYMERRSYATFEKRWPGKDLRVSSPQLSFEEYCNEEIPMEKVINIMVGDLQRIMIYPARGFQIEQEIPDEVWSAYEQLLERGFIHHLAKD